MKKYSVFTLLLFFLSTPIYSQHFQVSGIVTDSETGLPLIYANIRTADHSIGTASNKEGKFEIKIKKGSHVIITSFLGYVSDTTFVEVVNDLKEIKIALKPSFINLSEITVLPGENPADEIIRRAIKRKHERDEKIESYTFTAYTKGVVKSTEEVTAGQSSISIGVGFTDSSELKINGILENQSIGYFKKPDYYKEKILARKQTANFPSTINMLTGGRIIQDFYSDDTRFFGRKINGPLGDNSLSYYYFYIEDTVSIDNQNVFKLYMVPDDSLDPGFVGHVFISGNNYDLLKVDLQLNRAANPGGLFDTISIFQQFFPFGDSLFMPVDYHLIVSAKILNLIKIGFELNTILYDYKMNIPIDEKLFDMAVLTVLPDADEKDSTYWDVIQKIPNTFEEVNAYKRIDSVQNVQLTFWENFSFLSSRIELSKNFSVSAPLGMYHFNRVEGHSIDFGFFVNNADKNRLNSSLVFNYGFADKKLKHDLDFTYLFGDYRTYKLNLGVYNKTNKLYETSKDYSEFLSSLLSLLSKDDINDYYYSKGFSISFGGEVLPFLSLYATGIHNVDKTAYVNTNFSIFAKSKNFRANPAVYETMLNYLKLNFKIDFRKYFEDGMNRVRISQGKNYAIFDGTYTFSGKNLFNSDLDFNTIDLKLSGVFNTFSNTAINYVIRGFYTDGTLPPQMLYAVPGNINLTSTDFTFRTLGFNEVFGDRVLTCNLEYNLQDDFFRWLGVPYLKTMELQTKWFFNAAYSDIGSKSAAIFSGSTPIYKNPLFEIGFSVGHLLFPIQISFAWKLNHTEINSFRIGLSSLIIN